MMGDVPEAGDPLTTALAFAAVYAVSVGATMVGIWWLEKLREHYGERGRSR